MSAQVEAAQRVLRLEAEGLQTVADSLNTSDRADAFTQAVDTIFALQGHLVVVGVGKSGHIGAKIAASFASTGTPSFFLHPTEASHGDLGMITPDCGVLAVSNSGESAEMADVLRFCRAASIPVISITAHADSTLARASETVLLLPELTEACTNNLAPTTSTTAALALGDALVLAVMNAKGVGPEDFGRHHPGGKLGRGLQTVREWFEANSHTPPTISKSAGMGDVVMSISEGRAGCVAVVDGSGIFRGMVTDGDLRRAMGPDMFSLSAADVMTRDPFTLSDDMRMRDVADALSERKIGNAFLLRDGKPVAVVTLKQLVAQGYV